MVTSPAETRRLLSKTSESGTPRVGMHLYQNDDDDDDDVSVLTFHTMGTQMNDTRRLSGGGGSNYIKSARQSLDRLSLLFDGKTMASGDLLRISEEESQMSSCHSKNSRSRSSVSTRDEEEKSKKTDVDEEDDDDTISLAQSVFSNTNKVLSSIDSSPYRRNKREVSSTTSKESPMKSTDEEDRNKDDRKYKFVNTSISDMKKKYNFTSTKDKISNDTKTLEVSSSFLRSYFRDDDNENRKPTTTNRYYNQDRSKSSITTSRLITKCGIRDNNKEKHIQQLESETKQLQELLKERQNETRKSSETVGTSIRNANKLLEKISVGRKM